jgi:hypothetical protein
MLASEMQEARADFRIREKGPFGDEVVPEVVEAGQTLREVVTRYEKVRA